VEYIEQSPKFFIISLENHISNGGFALNYFKQIYLTKQQNIPQETLTFNLTPKSAVLIPKERSEYTGKGTQTKTATFNAKIHIVDASSTSDIYLRIKNNSNNPVTTTISNVTYPTTTQINGGQRKEVLIDNAYKNKYTKTNIRINFKYPDKSEIKIWVCYSEKARGGEVCLPGKDGVTIQLK
jgi:hypothetical protein